ncbi:hypothetical protein SODALDRAFT_333482 [Sodiomyces alkalinus F11]|uniref:Septin-type G domain-containing protein n=1 Tax=Sodiomyces alkalinus (strain CBS 110278 / VKM F-3762 / F11) TaxID=1314773 RepID=A0A3N2PWI5_SODAK|nr:hypothetical protein SODALDRAFT_333482 [Sodiomyces alkalinus F11]ROT38852.1 hypothetical protein SODALDRAFT_333482 [Sodiomyces alkalinus F11]
MRPIPGSNTTVPGGAAFASGLEASPPLTSMTPQMSFVLTEDPTRDVPRPLVPRPGNHHSRDRMKHSTQDKSRETNLSSDDIPRTSAKQHDPVSSTRSSSPSDCNRPSSWWMPIGQARTRREICGPSSVLSSPSCNEYSLCDSSSDDQDSVVLSVVDGSCLDFSFSPSEQDSQDAPQLIMPRLLMPSRGSFTEEGKSLGNLKLLVAGDTGLGKTSLIESIIQACRHIIHVDTAVPTSTSNGHESIPTGPHTMDQLRSLDGGIPDITEVYASTKPRPPWWYLAESVDSHSRHGSSDDGILERNICLVDTPGYSATSEPMDVITRVARYIEDHLHDGGWVGLDDADVLSVLNTNNGPLVDAAIYMISSSGLTSNDIQFLHCLENRTNIIPVLAQTDTLQPEQVAQKKRHILGELIKNHILPFKFDLPTLTQHNGPHIIYAITNERVSPVNVEAGLLRSEYVTPQIHSDLSCLVNNIFSVHGSARLRYAAVQKLLSCRRQSSHLLPTSATLGHKVITTPSNIYHTTWTSLHSSEACLLADTGHDFFRVSLENWASGLRQSLRKQHAAREQWMLHPQPCEMRSLLAKNTSNSLQRTHSRSKGMLSSVDASWPVVRQQDPLGLVEYSFPLKWAGWNIAQLIGSASMVGSLAIWLYY